MRSIQSKMLTEIETMVGDRQQRMPLDLWDIEAVATYKDPNVGVVLVQIGTDTPLRIGFEFNATSCRIDFTGPTVDASAFEDTPPVWRKERTLQGKAKVAFYDLDYADSIRLRAMWDMLAALLDTIGSEVAS